MCNVSRAGGIAESRKLTAAGYRTTIRAITSSSYGVSFCATYHSLNPHPALSPPPLRDDLLPESDQIQKEQLYRQLLVQSALAILLPTEDLQNACLRTLVGDIVADLILGQGVGGKVCEGWFLHESIIKVVEIIKARIQPKATGAVMEHDTKSRLEKFGLLSSKDEHRESYSSLSDQSWLSIVFWRTLQYAYLLFVFLRFACAGLSEARYSAGRATYMRISPLSPIASKASLASLETHQVLRHETTPSGPTPILEFNIFMLLSSLIQLPSRMPWLSGSLLLCQNAVVAGPGFLGGTNSLLDK